ncbi:MAG TPA: hypothetical protein VF234_05065 [Limnochordia bacterium]
MRNACRGWAIGVMIGLAFGMALGVHGASRLGPRDPAPGVSALVKGETFVAAAGEEFRLGYTAGVIDLAKVLAWSEGVARLEEAYALTNEPLSEEAVQALARGLAVEAAAGALEPPPGSSIPLSQYTEIAERYIQLHANEREESAAWLVWRAAAEALHP